MAEHTHQWRLWKVSYEPYWTDDGQLVRGTQRFLCECGDSKRETVVDIPAGEEPYPTDDQPRIRP